MSRWALDIAKRIKEKPKETEQSSIATVISKTPFKMSMLDGEIIIEEGPMLKELKDFYKWRTTAEEEEIIGKKVLLIGTQTFIAVGEVI